MKPFKISARRGALLVLGAFGSLVTSLGTTWAHGNVSPKDAAGGGAVSSAPDIASHNGTAIRFSDNVTKKQPSEFPKATAKTPANDTLSGDGRAKDKFKSRQVPSNTGIPKSGGSGQK